MEHTSTTVYHHGSTAAATAVGGGIRWNSPIPYLFGGMAMVLGLIAVALIILACTQDKHSDEKEKDAAGKSSDIVDDGPKFVVIMAGAHNPTFLARPVPKPDPVVVATSSDITNTSTVHLPTGDEQSLH
ncbi:hypothetical protein V2J09_023309 [Rumex salicifolius]